LRLLPLLLVGLLLIGAAWWFRSSSWMREAILRGKDLSELEAIVRQHPDDAIAQYYLAKRYFLNHQFVDARTAYEATTRLDPNSARAHLGLGLTWFELHQIQSSQDELTQALTLDHQLPWAEYMLGRIAWLEGNSEAAIPHLQRAIKLDSRSAVAWYGLAVCYIQLGHRDTALGAMQQAVAHDETNTRYHTTLGELLVFQGKTEEGHREYDRALQLDPNYGPAVALMGSLYLYNLPGKDSQARAAELLQRATHLPSYHPQDVYFDLSQLYFRQGKYLQALPMLQKAIQADPRDERPYYLLTQIERRLGDSKAAAAANTKFQYISQRHVQKDDLEMHLRQAPADTPSRLKLARVYADLGLASQAIRQYQICLHQQPRATETARKLDQFVQQQRAQADANSQSRDFVMPSLH
jgi:tetratricopeptide (TPR) repeat protein